MSTVLRGKKKWPSIAPIYDKYFGEGGELEMKHQAKKTVDAKIREKVAVSVGNNGGPSRNELMLKAKDLGVKNFRVLNKEELAEVVEKVKSDPVRVQNIVSVAVERWRSGWGSKTKKK
ncbi:MAG: hypothetical protein [Siphoviridae sp. ctCJE6]|nr:MAG: hypothetical protein [Siphoviridae sp. ctCJE6]